MAEDRKVSERYRELPREEPPRALDDAILAASRRAVHSRPGMRRWTVPLATAATLVLVVALGVLVERERPDAEVVSPQIEVLKTPAPPPAPAAPEAPRREPRPFRATPEFPSRGDVARAPAPAEAPAAPAAPAAQAERSEAAGALSGARESRDQRSSARMASVEAGPEAELERIARLRSAGRHEEADKALAEFRKRNPDYRIAPAMLERVEKK